MSTPAKLTVDGDGRVHGANVAASPQTWGGKNLKAGTTYTAGVRARDKKGSNEGPWVRVTFATPAS